MNDKYYDKAREEVQRTLNNRSALYLVPNAHLRLAIHDAIERQKDPEKREALNRVYRELTEHILADAK